MSEQNIDLRFIRWQLADGAIIYAPYEAARRIVVVYAGERRLLTIQESAVNYVRNRGQVVSKTLVERIDE